MIEMLLKMTFEVEELQIQSSRNFLDIIYLLSTNITTILVEL